jgi:hypothetical protein
MFLALMDFVFAPLEADSMLAKQLKDCNNLKITVATALR